MKRFLGWIGVPAVLLVLGGFYLGCTPDYPKCKTDEHCKEQGEFCVNGMCKKCRDDKDCGGNLCVVCEGSTYTCEKRPGCCTTDLDCPGGRCWVEPGQNTGKCGAICKTDEHCNSQPGCAGNACKCDNGVCRKKFQCTSDADCGPNQQCINNFCQDKPRCDLENVFFDFNESKIREDMKPVLDRNSSCIKSRNTAVKVEGHCDERGTAEYNMALGERRANASKNYLVNSGVGGGLLSTVSYGKERPVCTESNETCWKRNRRSVFLFQ